jgi:hypothetical protein
MISRHGTYGEHGPFIVFKLEETTEIMWSCAMPYVPATNALVGRIEDGETDVTTWYKVESVRFEFYHDSDTIKDSDGNPVELAVQSDFVGVCVYVSAVI